LARELARVSISEEKKLLGSPSTALTFRQVDVHFAREYSRDSVKARLSCVAAPFVTTTTAINEEKVLRINGEVER
jgi:hypothetical protein